MDMIEKMSRFDLLEKLKEIKSEIGIKEKKMHDLRLRINEEANELIKKKKLEMLTKVKPFAAEYERRKKELQKAYQLQKKRLDEKMWKEIEVLQKKKHIQCDEHENSFNVEVVPGHQSACFASERQENRGLK